VTDFGWIEGAIAAARPQAMAALLRYFREMDAAEEAFQDACLRALKAWPKNGPPRDPTAWLIMVGRNAAIDAIRKSSRETVLPPEELLSDLEDAEAEIADRLDGSHYRDDVLRLLFICCHPDLPATQQIALALRIVSGLSVREIARAFVVGEAAMEQRITRAKARIGVGDAPFEDARADRTRRALRGRGGDDLPGLQRGLFGQRQGDRGQAAASVMKPSAWRALLLRLFPAEPEMMGLTALLLLQHARSIARFDADGAAILLEDQDRSLWNRAMIGEGLALIDKAMLKRNPGPYQVQAAIAALHARAPVPRTPTGLASTCSTRRWRSCSPRR
jgi:RNA polymerase sigma-70 factor (ECF subfamily)